MFIPDTQARCGNFEDVEKELPSARGAGGEEGEGWGTLIIIQLFMMELLEPS